MLIPEVKCSMEQPMGKFSIVTIGKYQFAFSYKTLIAFNDGKKWVKRQNLWGPTTGKHLNWIPNGSGYGMTKEDKKARLDQGQFLLALAEFAEKFT